MFKFTATVEKQAERAAVHPPDVHSLGSHQKLANGKWTEQGPPWGGLQQHSTCPILGGICVMCRFLAPPPLSFSWYKIHCNLVLWNTLNSKTEKKNKKNFHSGSFRKFICLVMQSSVGYLLQVQNRKRRRVEKSLGKLHFAGDLEAFACAGWKWFTLATLYRAARFTPRVPGRLEAVGWAGIRQIAEAFQ